MALANTLGTDMAVLARTLQARGRGKDTILAHINPREAAMLKAQGGRGSRNPHTGLLEFDDVPIENVNVTAPAPIAPNIDVSGASAPVQQSAPEQVTSTANKQQPTSITTTPDISSGLTPLAAPQVAAAPAAPAPAVTAAPAPSAPEQVTVQAPSVSTPNFGMFPAPVLPDQTQPAAPSTDQNVKGFLSNNSTLLSLLGLGGLGVLGARNAANSGQQASALQSNLTSLAQPFQSLGNTTLATTMAGGLTPGNMQVLQAVQAQLGQQQAMGAVSAQQVAQAISGTFGNLLTTQLNQAVSLLNTADSYLQNAYLQGYQAQVANQTNTTNFYTNLAQMAARLAGEGGGTTINLGGQ